MEVVVSPRNLYKMSKNKKNAISPTRNEEFSEWYQSVVKEAELADNSSVRGSMVIKPWAFLIWTSLKETLNKEILSAGYENAYFPTLIPLSLFQKEADHVSGFATECAVVTHHKLEKNKDGQLVPAGPLEEPLVLRPTSEMIINQSFSKWISSYNDLPLKINQWCNVFRWELRTRLFLRTSEILWQEGHAVFASEKEAKKHAKDMLSLYRKFCEETLAIPVFCGEKPYWEKFPGAQNTYTFEAIMQDGKALQCGTSHFLGTNFSKASSITFQDSSGEVQYGFTTSFGTTTRLLGALIMVHGDDDGIVIPPNAIQNKLVVIPVIKLDSDREKILKYCHKIKSALHGVIIDNSSSNMGVKNWSWVKKGIPMRVFVGLNEVENSSVCLMRRDEPVKNKITLPLKEFFSTFNLICEDIQAGLKNRAKKYLEELRFEVHTKQDLVDFMKSGKKGFIECYLANDASVKSFIDDYHFTARCILDGEPSDCVVSGGKAQKMLLAKAY